MPNLIQQYKALKLAGITVGQTNVYYLQKVLKLLSQKYNTTQIRFWGKILGKKDYYVIQGKSKNKHLSHVLPQDQKYGQGVNQYGYWVANDILGQWTQLPIVSAKQVQASRQIKYIFTGNLQQPVNSLFKFNGLQKHLLKCVIARITHGCLLSPKGLFKTNQDNAQIIQFQQFQQGQGFKLPQISQMINLQNWVHLPANILNCGRVSYYIPSNLTQQQSQELKAQLQQKQPIVQRLRTITQDKPYVFNGYQAPAGWSSKLCGETIPVAQIDRLEGQNFIYGVAVLNNLSWPGATTICYQGGWTNIYIGYGHKSNQQLNIIKQLADLQIQGNDIIQFSEPNPSKPPVIQKPEGQQGEKAQGQEQDQKQQGQDEQQN